MVLIKVAAPRGRRTVHGKLAKLANPLCAQGQSKGGENKRCRGQKKGGLAARTLSRRETAPQLSAGFGSCVPDGQIKRGLDSPLSSTISTITPACFPVVHKLFNGKLSHESLLIHNTSSPTDHQKWRKSYPRRLIHFVVKRTVPQH